MHRNQDIFDFNIQYKNDIAFTQMKDVMYHILTAITANFDKFKAMIERQNIDFKSSGSVFSNAGYFYNNAQTSPAVKPYTDEEFENICMVFRTNLLKSSKFSIIALKFEDPIKCFVYFTKYLYIPVRLDSSTLPERMQKEFARWWITCISILLTLELYTVKFNSTIPTLDLYHECMRKAFQDEVMLGKLKLQTIDKIENYLISRYDPNHKVSVFYATMAKIIYNASIEIIEKFCPNYRIVKNINPKYDGAWLSPFDSDVNDQKAHIRKCITDIF